MADSSDPRVLLDIRDLKTYFPVRRGVLRRIGGWVKAVDGVSFILKEGQNLGLVGESGCGKTTVIRTIIRAVEPTSGEVLFRIGDDLTDVVKMGKTEMTAVWKSMRMIFQDPDSSLNPRMTIKEIIAEPLRMHRVATKGKRLDEIVQELMLKVGLDPAYLRHYPHAFSGGQRQRIVIARALALEPVLLLADEPTSALDVSVQSQILNLLLTLQKEANLTFVFVSHDLRVVRHVSDFVAVMYLGRIVEFGSAAEIFARPLHPYTHALLSSIPDPDPHRQRRRTALRGDIPDPADRPPGCAFHPRCPLAIARCSEEAPSLVAVDNGHKAACHVVAGGH